MRIELTHMAPEAIALSTELRVHTGYFILLYEKFQEV